MQTKVYLVITLLTFMALIFVSDGFTQQALLQPSVRLVYFLPNDRPARPDRIEAFRQLIKDVQQFYAEEMERHGYGRKPFRVETDTDGEPVVHQFNGKFPENYYYQRLTDFKVWEEFFQQVNDLQHIYLIAIDLSYELLNEGEACGLGGPSFVPTGDERFSFTFGSGAIRHRDITRGQHILGGSAIIPASGHCFFDDVYTHNHPLRVTVHELGHTFGLEHDDRGGFERDAAIGGSGDHLSYCDAEWLSVSRLFNSDPVPDTSRGEIQLLVPPTHTIEGIKLRFEVTDADGLHQAQLLIPENRGGEAWGAYRLLDDCKRLDGSTQIVEFISSALIVDPVDRVTLQIIDKNGGITWATFRVNIATLLPPPKVVSIPDPNLAIAIRTELDLAPHAPITDRAMLRLTRLDARENQIKDLTGLEHATELRYLELRKNQIQDIRPLANLKKLKELILEVNDVRDIRPLSNLTQLTLLYIAANPISDFTPLANLTELRRLALWDNNISDLTLLADKVQLTHLHLWNNTISDISPLANLTQLQTLHLQRNQIRDVSPLANLTKLTDLTLGDNQISDVSPLTGLVNLEALSLIRNPIKNRRPLLAMLRRNPDIKIYLKEGGDPLPVSLSGFRAELTDAGIIIKWITESELDNAGFNILRSETKDGEFKIVNPQLIQGAGTSSERNEYTWTDTTAKPNVVYYYRIEDISHAGVRQQLATVRMRGYMSAVGKFTTKWGDLKLLE